MNCWFQWIFFFFLILFSWVLFCSRIGFILFFIFLFLWVICFFIWIFFGPARPGLNPAILFFLIKRKRVIWTYNFRFWAGNFCLSYHWLLVRNMEATYNIGSDVDVCRMFDQYLYKVKRLLSEIIKEMDYVCVCVLLGKRLVCARFFGI